MHQKHGYIFSMKNLLLLFFVLVCSSIYAQKAENDSPQKIQKDSLKSLLKTRHSPSALSVYKTNPFSIIWGPIPYTAEYKLIRETAVSAHGSFLVGISFLGKSPLLSAAENAQQNNGSTSSAPNQDLKVRGWRLQLAYRYYLGKRKAPRGFYCGPQLSWANAIISEKGFSAGNYFLEATHFNLNALAGYQVIIRDKVAFDFFFGLGYKKNTWLEHYSGRVAVLHDFDDITPLYGTHLKVTLGINFGLAF